MNQHDQISEVLRLMSLVTPFDEESEDFLYQAEGLLRQALAAEPALLRFVQSDKGSVIVVINKGATLRHAYGVVVESTAYGNSPIEVADFVQEKDALLFAKIWNGARTELAEPAPLVRLTDEEIWKLWHELPQPTGKYAIARYAEEIMDAMERVNRRQLDQTPNSPSE